MSFVFSPLIIAIGALVLAGVLFALQHLKVRQRLVRLPAAALWIKAAGEAPARVMRQRFRYWLAYLVALVIVLQRLQAESGIVAITAAGVSPRRLVLPFVAVALTVATFVGVLGIGLTPDAPDFNLTVKVPFAL